MSRRQKVLVLFDLNHPVPLDYDYREDLKDEAFVAQAQVLSALEELGHQAQPFTFCDELAPLVERLTREPPDVVFNLSEAFAQDARHESHVAGLLELTRIPYTGAGPTSLALCKNKALAKKILTYHHIKTPHFLVSLKQRPLKRFSSLRFPVFIKPTGTESSVGIAQAALADDEGSALQRVEFIHGSVGSDALIEEYVEGRELYGGVIGNERLEALPLNELLIGDAPLGADATPAGAPRFLTYKAKWDDAYRDKWKISSGAPRDLDDAVEKAIRERVRRACQALQITGYGRVDLRLTPNGEIHVIEVNPNPGLAQEDDFAQVAKRGGMTYPALIDRILKLADRRS